MHEHERLSDFVDDTLAPSDRAAVAEHLAACDECRAIVEDLRSLTMAARQMQMDVAEPSADLWPGIAGRVDDRWRRTRSVSWPTLAAAAASVALVSSLSTWAILNRSAVVPATGGAGVATLPVVLGDTASDRAVAELLATLRAEGRNLSPRTLEVVTRSLAAIDEAIADAQVAIARDPGDIELVSYLADRRRARLTVLRQVERVSDEESGATAP